MNKKAKPVLRIAIAPTAIVATLLFAAPGATGAAPADPAKARVAFQACAACHSDKAGVTRLGPSLAGVFGKPAAQAKGFRYSPALAKAKLRWDRKTLDAFIANPKAVVPGNRMTYPGVSDPAKRAAIIDYMQGLR
jgi:cytochrome c